MPSFIFSLVGSPYKEHSYDGISFDCYTLVYHIYKHYNIDIPKHLVLMTLRGINEAIKNDLRQNLWKPVKFNERQFLDVLLFNTTVKFKTHMGLVINQQNFIHTNETINAVIGNFNKNIFLASLHRVYRWHTL